MSILRRLDGNQTLFGEMVELFVGFCPKMLADIEAAAADDDSEAVCLAARSFKEVLADFTRESPFELARRLEEMASADDLSHCHEILVALRQDVTQLIDELHGHQQALASDEINETRCNQKIWNFKRGATFI